MGNFFDEPEDEEIFFPLVSYKVYPCKRGFIEKFIEQNHYSGSINGCISDYCFALLRGTELVGALFYGKLAMANQYKRFCVKENDITELRRLCCIDNTPRNTESYFISRTLKWLQKNTKLKMVVSYADAEYGHTGTIYRASNFKYLGFSKGAKVIEYNGKLFHDKSIRTYYNGKLKPFAEELKLALENGTAKYKSTKGKHTYIYYLIKQKSVI